MIAEKRVELEIIALFDRRRYLTIHQISRLLNKSYPHIHKKVNEMLDEGVLRRTIIGNSHLCFLDLTNEKAVILLTLNELKKKKKLGITAEKQILELREKTVLHSMIYSDKKLVAVVERKPESVSTRIKLLTTSEIRKEFPKEYVVLYGYERFFEIMGQLQREKEVLVNE
ncbi:hypothetical protein JXA85_08690 [Candidatus Woesearchaeota archaeon]|nr:hypothetical protein [Candidatus Woesearchaeota archaeon]